MAEPSIGTTPDDEAPAGPVVRDRRRLDPETGQVRTAYTGTDAHPASAGNRTPAGTTTPEPGAAGNGTTPGAGTAALELELDAAHGLAEERLADLQRLQAEFVNYRRRVERDRELARAAAVAGVLESLLPVLDDVHLARQHGDLESGPFAAIADKLEATLGRLGLTRFGEPGETFDP